MKNFLAIAGNIGAGKTSLAQKLSRSLGWTLFEEPFAENPYLERFYQDMKAWAFHCETSFLAQRLQTHLHIAQKPDSFIQDRCLYEGAEIFTKNLYKKGFLSETDWQTYQHLYQNIASNLRHPDLIVYLQASPQHCLNNIKRRARDLEKNIDPIYLQELHNLYEEWIANFHFCPTLTVNIENVDFVSDDGAYQKIFKQIRHQLEPAQLDFLKNLCYNTNR